MQSLLDNKPLLVGAGLLALLIGVLLLLAIVQMLFRGRLRMPGGRTRQARLGIVDAFDLDRQRQLIIVRRDNTEHLIMIGGPNDLLIESEISRVEVRENRRDKLEGAGPALPQVSAFGEPRIPAPLPPVERVEPATRLAEPAPPPSAPPQAAPAPAPSKPPVSAPRPAAEPQVAALPPQIPPIVLAPGETVPRRAPTFPLPPRRTLPQAEPRPAPRPPENVPRVDLVPPPAPAAPAAAPPESTPEPAAPAAVRPVPQQFLRPLPPRPPIRTTPLAKPVPASPPPPSVSEIPAPPSPPVTSAQAPVDTMESLEEEMAKLLGRGMDEK
ncbi:MAG: hypothetical protein ABSA13_05590 [Beijerinckiaceae bacterium]